MVSFCFDFNCITFFLMPVGVGVALDNLEIW